MLDMTWGQRQVAQCSIRLAGYHHRAQNDRGRLRMASGYGSRPAREEFYESQDDRWHSSIRADLLSG